MSNCVFSSTHHMGIPLCPKIWLRRGVPIFGLLLCNRDPPFSLCSRHKPSLLTSGMFHVWVYHLFDMYSGEVPSHYSPVPGNQTCFAGRSFIYRYLKIKMTKWEFFIAIFDIVWFLEDDTLWQFNMAMEKLPTYSWLTHEKWWFSIAT